MSNLANYFSCRRKIVKNLVLKSKFGQFWGFNVEIDQNLAFLCQNFGY